MLKPTLLVILLAFTAIAPLEAAEKPNIIFILADDLGYGDLGCYGQRRIKTPTLDRLAADGLRFTQAYAGCTVCAPSRCTLLTGKHLGHAAVRGNSYTVLGDDPTIASLLRDAGYATGVVGKWGMAMANTPGPASQQGFDYFCGYMTHGDAHNYYPEFLWENDRKLPLVGNVVKKGVASQKQVYAPDVLGVKALEFIERQASGPFFLYLASPLPHANNEAQQEGMEVPNHDLYQHESWPEPQKNHAAMITRLDMYVGQVLDKLRELKLDTNTYIFFSSDNGPHQEGGATPEFFQSAGPLRGFKRSMHDGGLRVPLIVRGPGITAGSVSELPFAFWDILPTVAELTNTRTPTGIDGLSLTPTLLGAQRAGHEQAKHDYFYWEFHERGFHQALRMGNWKAVRHGLNGPIALYDLRTDIHEDDDVAAKHPEIVEQISQRLKEARVDHPRFKVAL